MEIALVSVEFVRVNAAAVVEMLRLTFVCVTGGAPSSAAATVSVFVPAVIEVGVSTVMVELPTPGVSIGGLNEHVTPGGTLVQLRPTAVLKPFFAVDVTVYVVPAPGGMVRVVGENASDIPCTTSVRFSACVLPPPVAGSGTA